MHNAATHKQAQTDLGWVLATECPSTVCPPAPIRVHYDLAPSQTSISHWPTQDETARDMMCTEQGGKGVCGV